VERSGRSPIEVVYRLLTGGTDQNHYKSRDNLSAGRHFNLGPHQLEAGVLFRWPRRSPPYCCHLTSASPSSWLSKTVRRRSTS